MVETEMVCPLLISPQNLKAACNGRRSNVEE